MQEKHLKVLKSIENDLELSINSPLLLEISLRDLEKIKDDSQGYSISNCSDKIIELANNYYNDRFKVAENYTNVLLIDNINKSDVNQIVLYHELVYSLEDQIKKDLILDVIKDVLNATISIGLKNVGVDFINILTLGHASDIITHTSNYLVENTSNILDAETSKKFIDTIVDTITEKNTNDFMSDLAELSSEEFINQKIEKAKEENNNKDNNNKKLYLSSKAKTLLKSSYNEFSEVSFSKALQLLLDLIILIGKDAPKLIIIKNPHKLDIVSISIISQYFSLIKDLDNKKELPLISFMFIYEEEYLNASIPYYIDKQNNSTYTFNIKKFLDEQRLFLQRYHFLAQPNTDIPTFAVKSNLFVGRTNELEKLNERTMEFEEKCKNKINNQNICIVDIIQAEPGIGKTALYNEHIKKFLDPMDTNNTKRELILKLSIYNGNELSNLTTGLVSFSDSITYEYKRLTEYYIKHCKLKAQGRKLFPKKIREMLLDSMEDGLSKIRDIGVSIRKLSYVNHNLNTMSTSLLDSSSSYKQQKKEEEHFQALLDQIAALKKTLNYIDNDIDPSIILFIDDIHWLDNQTSKFLVTKLINNNDIRIIITARTADTNSRYKLYSQYVDTYIYNLALFEKLKLIQEDIFVKDEEKDIILSSMKYNVALHQLEGFNAVLVNDLLRQVIHNSNDDNTQYLANSIIRYLANTDEAERVITLFAIETINIICDKRFYDDDMDNEIETITPIVKEENSVLYFIDQPFYSFKKNIDNIFKHLLSKVEASASFFIDNNTDSQKNILNLASFAILEERLRLLSMYFKADRGEAIIQNILFSSVLGSPFNRNIVTKLIQEIINSDQYILRPLQLRLKDQNSFNDNDFMLLENIYKIIYKILELETYYSYSHALLGIFLETKLEYFFDTCYDENEAIKDEAKNIFYKTIYHFIDLKYPVSYDSNNINKNILSSKINLRIVKKAYEHNQNEWVLTYSSRLYELALLYERDNQYVEAINLLITNRDIIKVYYHENSNTYFGLYVDILVQLGSCYNMINHHTDARQAAHEVSFIRGINYNKNKSSINVTREYIQSLITFASYYSLEFKEERIYLIENDGANFPFDDLIKAYNIVYELYISNNEEWVNDYFNTLICFVQYYPMYFKSHKYLKECLKISEKEYKINPDLWKSSFLKVSRELIKNYETQNLYDSSLPICLQLVKITKEDYENNNSLGTLYQYSQSLLFLGKTYINKGNYSDTEKEKKLCYTNAIDILELAKNILGVVTLESINTKSTIYSGIVVVLDNAYKQNNNTQKALELKKDIDAIRKYWTSNFMDKDTLRRYERNVAFTKYQNSLEDFATWLDEVEYQIPSISSKDRLVKLQKYLRHIWSNVFK